MKRPIILRICGPGDESALRRLAGRDTARQLEGTILAAEVEDELLAAICLETGRVVADPFSHTATLVDLLRGRAAQLQAAQLQTARDPLLRRGSRRLRGAWGWLAGPAPEANS